MTGTTIIQLPWGGAEDPHWRALQELSPASLDQIWSAAPDRLRIIRKKLREWVRAGFVSIINGKPERFAMSKSMKGQPVQPDTIKVLKGRRQRSQPSRIWSAIRVFKRCDLTQLAIAADVTDDAARRYLGLLERAGYVERRTVEGVEQFTLINWTGPSAPTLRERDQDGCKQRLLADPNTGALHHLPPRRSYAARPAAALFFARES